MVSRSVKFLACSFLLLNLESMLNPLSANTLARYGRRVIPSITNHLSHKAPVLGSGFNQNSRFFSSNGIGSDDVNTQLNQQNFASQNSLSKDDLEQIKSLIEENRESLL